MPDMQLTCPECGKQITAENINIQQMVAVCSACDTVFQFEPPQAKAKRRKVKQPQHLIVKDTDNLHMDFHTNFRLDRDEMFLSSTIVSFMATLITIIFVWEFLAGQASVLVPMIGALVTLITYYAVALQVFNKTHIEMDEDTITLSRQPLPNPLSQPNHISLHGVVGFRCEETPISVKEAYDTPRYRVWAETADGRRKFILKDVTEEYAVFITQRMQEQLHTTSMPSSNEDEAIDLSRLIRGAEEDTYDDLPTTQNTHIN